MTDLSNVTEKTYVAKVSKRNNSVEFISMNDFNGLFSTNQELGAGYFDTVKAANVVANSMNNMYLELGLNYNCYVVRSVENNRHIMTNVPEDYQAIIRSHFGSDGEIPTEPVEPEPTEPAPEG